MRNYWLDALKLVFIIIISFWHTGWWYNLEHGYLPVEFFFIVSGYFIYRSSLRGKELGSFAGKKALRLFPTYLVILPIYICLFFLFRGFYPGSDNADIGLSIVREAMMLQATGIFEVSNLPMVAFNGNAWYVSSYFYGGLFVFLLSGVRRARVILLSVISVIFYVWILFLSAKGLNRYWGYESVFFIPLWRGIAGMGLGVLTGMATSSRWFEKNSRAYAVSFNLLAIIGLMTGLWCCFTTQDMDWLGILCFVVVFSNCLSPYGLSRIFMRWKFARYIPDISLEILLLHKFIIILAVKVCGVMHVIEYDVVKYCIYLGLNIGAALMIQKFVIPAVMTMWRKIISVKLQFG